MDNETHGDAAILARVENEILQRRADLGLLNQAKKEKGGRHVETLERYKELRFDAIKAKPENMAPPPVTRSHFLKPVSPVAAFAIQGLQWILLTDLARWIFVQIAPPYNDPSGAFTYLFFGAHGLVATAILTFLAKYNDTVVKALIIFFSLLSFPVTICLLRYLAPHDGLHLSLYATAKLADIAFGLLLIPSVGRFFFSPPEPPKESAENKD